MSDTGTSQPSPERRQAVPESDVAFPRLDAAQMATMAAAGRTVAVEPGQILFSPGDLDYQLIVVVSGGVEVLDAAGTERETVLVTYGPRQFAGELNLITMEPALLTARVTEAGEAILVSREALRTVVGHDTRLGDLIMNALVARRANIIESDAGARLIGSGGDPGTRQLREFLTRNRVPHRFIDLDAAGLSTSPLDGRPLAADDLPLLVTGKETLAAPTILEAATALNLRAPNKTAKVAWDCLIVGGGPGGLGAAVYAATEGLSTILVDSVALGGQASTSSRIENYLGFPAGVSGSDLAERAIAQARRFGLRTAVPERAEQLRTEEGRYVVELDSGDELAARTVVLATGASYRRLPVDGCEQLNGAGVFYAATLVEARMCGSEAVAVVGGGNSAGQAAIFLSGSTERVSLLLRGGDLGASMSNYLVEQIEAIDNIEVLLHTEVRETRGDASLEGIVVEETPSGERRDLDVGGLFIFIGADPCTEWLDGALAKDDDGFLLTGDEVEVAHLDADTGLGGRPAMPLETSLPGVFAVGDGRSGSIKRVASAVGEGSMSVRLIHQYLALQGQAPSGRR
ncbi:MAG TPA: FAD-dependent oxidoreductase [Solirubrobacterales bacterium]|nr:FAD-dependent oxidoreductase [Solirubrobacterales bacterium]